MTCVNELFSSLLSQGGLFEDRVQHLPTFLEALSSIIEELDEVCKLTHGISS